MGQKRIISRTPITSKGLLMKTLDILGCRIAYVDKGHGTPVVFVHGTPSSSREFEAVMSQLEGEYRCLALDHFGFGKSDKPPEADYSLEAHAARFAEWVAANAIGAFHLVVHDFGGVIALPFAANHWAQIKSLTLINTWGWPLEETEPTLKKQRYVMTSAVMRFLYLHANFSAQFLVKIAWGKHRALTKEHHNLYCQPFQNSRSRHGTVAFLQALFDSNNPAWKIGERLSMLKKKPVLILWGESDKMISTANLERWMQIFPNAKVEKFPQVGHFVCDEAPELVGPVLKQFFQSLDV